MLFAFVGRRPMERGSDAQVVAEEVAGTAEAQSEEGSRRASIGRIACAGNYAIRRSCCSRSSPSGRQDGHIGSSLKDECKVQAKQCKYDVAPWHWQGFAIASSKCQMKWHFPPTGPSNIRKRDQNCAPVGLCSLHVDLPAGITCTGYAEASTVYTVDQTNYDS